LSKGSTQHSDLDDLLPPLPEPPPPALANDPEAVQVANADISILEHVEALWPQVVRDVRPRDKMVYALIRDVRPVNVEGNTVILLASSPFHRGQIERPHIRQIIEEVLSKHLGAQFAIVCTLEERSEEQDLRGQIRKARKDPWVKAAINVFDADVVGIDPSDGKNEEQEGDVPS
jgi:DNA polymerase-3 subunit gamma/tau